MSAPMLMLLLVCAHGSNSLPTSGTQLTYRGTFESQLGEPAESRKEFELTLLFGQEEDGGARVDWVLQEKGFGGWPWTDRFGHYLLKPSGEVRGHLPRLLYERDSGTSEVALAGPRLVHDQPLTAAATWKTGELDFAVDGTTKRGKYNCFKVRATSPYGQRKTLWIDVDSGTLVSAQEDVTIGQGERHEIRLDLADQSRMDGNATRHLLQQLGALRSQLQVEPRTRNVNWNAAQLKLLRERLSKLAAAEIAGPVGELVAAAQEDAKEQDGRDNAVASIRKRIMGKPLPHLKLQDRFGKDFDPAAWKGKVTVLHFWQYRDKPLEEPYGQVGYLDFLFRKRQPQDVQVYGIVISESLEDPSKRASVMRSARKFQSFMRLSYPLLADAGEVLKAIGDPRPSGGKLPLVVVLDPTGRVVHYHVGFYPVDQRRGLAELDDVVTKALESGE